MIRALVQIFQRFKHPRYDSLVFAYFAAEPRSIAANFVNQPIYAGIITHGGNRHRFFDVAQIAHKGVNIFFIRKLVGMLHRTLHRFVGNMQRKQRSRHSFVQLASKVFRLYLIFAAKVVHQYILTGDSDNIGQFSFLIQLVAFLPHLRLFTVWPHKLRLDIAVFVQKLEIADKSHTFFAQFDRFQIFGKLGAPFFQPVGILRSQSFQVPFAVILADSFVEDGPAAGNLLFFGNIFPFVGKVFFAHVKHLHIAVVRIGNIGHIGQIQPSAFRQIGRKLVNAAFQHGQFLPGGRIVIVFVLFFLAGNFFVQPFVSVGQKPRRNNRQQRGAFRHFIGQPAFKFGALTRRQVFVLMECFHHRPRAFDGLGKSSVVNDFHIVQNLKLQGLKEKFVAVGMGAAQPFLFRLKSRCLLRCVLRGGSAALLDIGRAALLNIGAFSLNIIIFNRCFGRYSGGGRRTADNNVV